MKRTIAFIVLAFSTSAFAQQAPSTLPVLSGAPAQAIVTAPATVYSNNPNGEGDPNAITCRPPQTLLRSRLRGPEVCKTNAVWAQYRKDGMDVAADGIHDVASEKWRTIIPQVCHPATMGGSGTTNMNQANFSMICE
jgi:hypothetical protein